MHCANKRGTESSCKTRSAQTLFSSLGITDRSRRQSIIDHASERSEFFVQGECANPGQGRTAQFFHLFYSRSWILCPDRDQRRVVWPGASSPLWPAPPRVSQHPWKIRSSRRDRHEHAPPFYAQKIATVPAPSFSEPTHSRMIESTVRSGYHAFPGGRWSLTIDTEFGVAAKIPGNDQGGGQGVGFEGVVMGGEAITTSGLSSDVIEVVPKFRAFGHT